MVIVIQTRVLELFGLPFLEHAKRHAGLEAFGLHRGDHLAHLRKVAVLERAPGCAHAEAVCAIGFRAAGFGQNGVDFHQLGSGKTRLEMRGLAAIAAVFRATAGLDRKKLGFLDAPFRPVRFANLQGTEHQVRQGQVEQGRDLFARPVLTWRNRCLGHQQLPVR